MNTFRQGLYALILGGMTLSACNRSSEIIDREIPLSPIDTLEQIAQTEPVTKPLSKSIENSFVNPEKDYSLLLAPEDYGYQLSNRLADESVNFFMDIYTSEAGALTVSGVSTDMSLKEAYTNHSLHTAKYLGDNLSMTFASGEGFEIKGEGPERKITINGMSALRGGAEFWMFSGGTQALQRQKGDYTHKITMHCATAKENNNLYLFSIFYEQINPATDAKSEEFFEDVMKAFKPLR